MINRTKKSLIVALTIIAGASATYATSAMMNWNFTAPGLTNRNALAEPKPGDILYESTTGSFLGYTGNNDWLDFGDVASANNLTIATVSNTESINANIDLVYAETPTAYTLTLPSVGDNVGKVLEIRKTDNNLNALTIDGNGTEEIEGQNSISLSSPKENIKLVSDGTMWRILSKSYANDYIHLDTPGGSGSGAVRMRYFNNIRTQTQNGVISYNDANRVSQGSRFTALKKCRVTIVYSDSSTVSGAMMGITRNASGGSNVGLVPADQVLGINHNSIQTLSDLGQVTATAILNPGDYIAAQHDGNFSGGNANGKFTITAEEIP